MWGSGPTRTNCPTGNAARRTDIPRTSVESCPSRARTKCPERGTESHFWSRHLASCINYFTVDQPEGSACVELTATLVAATNISKDTLDLFENLAVIAHPESCTVHRAGPRPLWKALLPRCFPDWQRQCPYSRTPSRPAASRRATGRAVPYHAFASRLRRPWRTPDNLRPSSPIASRNRGISATLPAFINRGMTADTA